jgi:hypothetical protein
VFAMLYRLVTPYVDILSIYPEIDYLEFYFELFELEILSGSLI